MRRARRREVAFWLAYGLAVLAMGICLIDRRRARRTIPGRLAERVRRLDGDLVDVLAGHAAAQDVEWACEVWATVDGPAASL